MTKNTREKFYIVTGWLLICVVLMYCAFFTSANNYERISFSKDNNDIIEINKAAIAYVTLTEDLSDAFIYVGSLNDDIHYLRLFADGITEDNSRVSFSGGTVDEEGAFHLTYALEDAGLHNGENYYHITRTDYPYCWIKITGNGADKVKSIQFRESDEEVYTKENMYVVLTTGLLYVILSVIVAVLFKKVSGKRKKKCEDGIEIEGIKKDAFLIQGGPHCFCNKYASVIRTALLFLLITNSLVVAMGIIGVKYIADFHQYFFVQCFLIIVFILFIKEGRPLINERHSVDKPALVVCSSLALYMLVSDLLVEKTFRFAGISLFGILLLLGLLYNRDRNSLLIKNYDRAVHLFLVLLLLLCLMGDNSNISGRFAGPLNNPSIFALFVGGIWAVLLGSFEHLVITGADVKKKIFICVELFISIILVLLSQSLTPLIAMVAAAMLWVFRIITQKKGLRYAARMMLALAGIGLLVLVLLIVISNNAGMSLRLRLLEKFQSEGLSAFLSGRDYYWRAYLRKMNLFGHRSKLSLCGTKVNPHNALIGMAYMYGVPCLIPYIIMFMMAIEKSYRYANTSVPYAATPLYAIVTFVIMGIADNVEQPLVWLPTISCYLLMPLIMIIPVEDMVEDIKKDGKTQGDRQ